MERTLPSRVERRRRDTETVASAPDRGPGEQGLRASDADRERVAAVLRQHCSAGRLSFEELADRLERVYEARTLDQLFSLTNDMPDPEPHPHLAERLPELRTVFPSKRAFVAVDLTILVVFSAVLVGVWAAAGGGYFWPIWPIVAWAVLVVMHAVRVIRRSGGEPGAG